MDKIKQRLIRILNKIGITIDVKGDKEKAILWINNKIITPEQLADQILKREEAHKTRDGYCCACDYDIIGIKELREDTIKEWSEELERKARDSFKEWKEKYGEKLREDIKQEILEKLPKDEENWYSLTEIKKIIKEI